MPSSIFSTRTTNVFLDRKSGFDAVVSWFKEKSSYNLLEDSCSGVCGHYTQVEHHRHLLVEWLLVSDNTVCLSHLYFFCRLCGQTRNIWVVVQRSVRSSSMEEGDTIMFVTMDQGNQYKTIFLSINKWTKSLSFINTLSKFCLSENILSFTSNFKTKYQYIIISRDKKNICKEKKNKVQKVRL